MPWDNPFKRPGEVTLDKWRQSGLPGGEKKPDSASLTRGGGGLGQAARDTVEAWKRVAAEKQAGAESPPELDNDGAVQPKNPQEKKPEAVLWDPKWSESDTRFHQEAEVSVKVKLPEGKQHLTRVQAELFAKTPSGRESIARAEGHARADSTAVVTFPIYKPKNHDGSPVEYFFEVMHKLAMPVNTETLTRKVSQTALISAAHVLVPGIGFAQDSSFIGPQAAEGFREVESKLKEWGEWDSKKAKIVVFGHADREEKNAKAISERRAQSAYAFITQDASTWEKLYGIEKWGLLALQILLKDLGHYREMPDGKAGLKTQEALKAIQHKAGLPATGKEDPATRQALFAAYMESKHNIKIEASRFRQVSGNPWMGCASNNHAKEGDGPAPENRRVAFILIKESRFFPVYFPCQDASEAACLGQCKKAGKRSEPGIKCAFYDELVREEKQAPTAHAGTETQSDPPWMAVARREIGVTEIPGPKHNARILEYHRTVDNPPTNDDNTGAWCASFVNWCLQQAGFDGQNTARAAAWAGYGREVKTPIHGAIALIHFKKGGHHVGFVDGRKGKNILLLGGNQQGGTMVCVSEFKTDEVQGYRLPNGYTGPEIEARKVEGEHGRDD